MTKLFDNEVITRRLEEFAGYGVTFSSTDVVKDSDGERLVLGEAVERTGTDLAGYILAFSPSDDDTFIYVGLHWPPQLMGGVIRSLPRYWVMAKGPIGLGLLY